MANKKRKKTAPKRRRRIGAVAMNARSPLVTYGSIALGFLAGNKINAALDSVIPANVDRKIVGAAEAGLGYFLISNKKKTMLTTVAGGVMIGAGAKQLMAAFGIGGISLGGYQKVPSVAGYIPGSQGLNGYTPQRTPINGYGKVPSVGTVISGIADGVMDR